MGFKESRTQAHWRSYRGIINNRCWDVECRIQCHAMSFISPVNPTQHLPSSTPRLFHTYSLSSLPPLSANGRLYPHNGWLSSQDSLESHVYLYPLSSPVVHKGQSFDPTPTPSSFRCLKKCQDTGVGYRIAKPEKHRIAQGSLRLCLRTN